MAAYAVANGTNTYVATISGYTLVEGQSVKIKFINANTSVSTLNINSLGAKSIVKGNGSTLTSGSIKAAQICNLVYTGSVFQLLGEGGEYGTATASDVLSGKTIGTEDGLIEGTIPIKSAATIIPATTNQVIAAGQYLSGIQTIAGDADLISSNIKAGANIFGVAGNSNIVDTSAGDAVASQVLSGKKAYVDGALITGTMPNNGAQSDTITKQGGTKAIPAGYTTGGTVTASFANLSSENIKSGVNVGGVVGTLKPLTMTSGTIASQSLGGYSTKTFQLNLPSGGADAVVAVSRRTWSVDSRPAISMIYDNVDGKFKGVNKINYIASVSNSYSDNLYMEYTVIDRTQIIITLENTSSANGQATAPIDWYCYNFG
ncbi:hypothetical protein J2Z76_000435 [Sedimentibacter acidaminivorans]|uniref:Uncharacterized protein n=1 Tax=Sedimentibacter acidaminivorans TaxID=913099 RepID=A0ABS4GAM0_9FIRM|nr:hypothetical protein [Sedimentibacter acidaminivorans]MBP1924582.1 hypothetical protein [Sedimentibacter acidaminivorans]